MFNINPKQMQGMMKKMGIKQEELDASEVIIKLEDKELVINNPTVAKIEMQGNASFQISGDVEERELKAEISEEDVKTVMEQAEVDEEKARSALEEAEGDLAKAILELSS